MDRITIKDLDTQVGIINGLIGGDHSHEKHYAQGYRLCKNHNSVKLSPIVSKRELFEILRAYSMGILVERFGHETRDSAGYMNPCCSSDQPHDGDGPIPQWLLDTEYSEEKNGGDA